MLDGRIWVSYEAAREALSEVRGRLGIPDEALLSVELRLLECIQFGREAVDREARDLERRL